MDTMFPTKFAFTRTGFCCRRLSVSVVATPARKVTSCGSATQLGCTPAIDDNATTYTLAFTVDSPSGSRASETDADEQPGVSAAVTSNEQAPVPITCRHCAPTGTVLISSVAVPIASPSPDAAS